MTGTPHEDERYHVDFVCTGNICRSPMAEVIFHDAVEAAGLHDQIRVSSCGIGGWHVGNGADRRAIAELRAAGHDGSDHIASQLGPEDMAADLLVALDTGHVSELIARGVPEDKIRLLRSFDPAAPEQASVADPYYGGPEGFVETREQIEAAVDGLMIFVRDAMQVGTRAN
ncbi:MAG: low molecular weight protein-tyrosine-phosphatase [Corynebacterium sp.]|uniref:low molecular weight protein-tyrosine-phosphatase n=1 Tax=Corynebacterium sp. TaxID=1720 RepID=UPI0026E08CAD|nr:low molecular weight protein-tyrosine-phosphatase [Corynebacterium sp.]MDO5669145.1 low molecular weight protein-tyrosine-phosphatase [Corynebacterium sp.]